MRRLTLLVAGGALWLFLAAIPALADGGPHVAANNSGTSTLTADSCAGCHRAHTAQAAYLLAEEEEALCLTCHGSQGVGATTDVELGIQYKVAFAPGSAGQGTDPSVIAGALRGGGFVEARISSTNPTRISYPRIPTGETVPVASFSSWVKVAAGGNAVTSAHMDFDPNTSNVVSQGRVWGNGAIDSGAGPAPVSLSCGSCHNPHGNGQYRILNTVPKPESTAGTTPAFSPVSAPGVTVTDDTTNTGVGIATRNYTVKQASGGTTTLLLSSVSGTPPTDGDYWRKIVPWNSVPTWTNSAISGTAGPGDRPNGLTNWEVQLSQWCTACHSRYYAPTGSYKTDSTDDIFKYRHGIYRPSTTGGAPSASTECTQCHVSHGSNAAMPGDYSSVYPYPHQPGTAAVTSDSSRLLKVDDRGTCQQCHDPTLTISYNGVISNPVP